MDDFNEFAAVYKEQLSSQLLSHKMEIDQLIFKFRNDNYHVTTLASENNKIVKKFQEAVAQYEVQMKVRVNKSSRSLLIIKEFQMLADLSFNNIQ